MKSRWAAGAGMLLILVPQGVRADAFDDYFAGALALVPMSKNAEKVAELTPDLMVRSSRVLPNITATFLVVKTNEGRLCKLLVQPARQKVSADASVPILLIERYVTFREGEDRAVQAQGKDVRLFHDFRLSLDIGQIVPKEIGADLRFVAEGDKIFVEPVGKAEIYLVTRHTPVSAPDAAPKFVAGGKFEAKYFTGSYKLHDDGRRTGILKLNVTEDGEVSGDYYSDKDGQRYEVSGKVGMPNHAIQFRITYPRTVQFFSGFMFTGDAQTITGTSRLQERETGFYAARVRDP